MQRLRMEILALREQGLSPSEIAHRLGVPRRRVDALLRRRARFAPRPCELCGKRFTPTGGRQRYCTPEHRQQHHRGNAPKTRACELCGQAFTPTGGRQRFCTPEHQRLRATPRTVAEARARVIALEAELARVRDQLGEPA